MKEQIIIFGGTSEGRILCEELWKNPFIKKNIAVTVCVATDYGEYALSSRQDWISVNVKRLTSAEMVKLFQLKNPLYVIDATHPFAKEVTDNIVNACNLTKTAYLRINRTTNIIKNAIYFDSLKEACKYVSDKNGNILLTTGSKELKPVITIPNYQNRLFVRVLPTVVSIEALHDYGIIGKQIIAMQGPFSKELNTALLRETNSSYLITKDSGRLGGLENKIAAAKETKTTLLVIRRPVDQEGCSLEKAISYIIKNVAKKKGQYEKD